MNFKSIASLQPVVNVINEAEEALHNTDRVIKDSAIPEVLIGALGAGIGGVASFALLYGLGTVGISAIGITSGLTVAGGLIGGATVAGAFVIAAPLVVLGGVGTCIAISTKNKRVNNEKARLYQEVLKQHNAIIKAQEDEIKKTKERMDYLESLNILLKQAIHDLRSDLGHALMVI